MHPKRHHESGRETMLKENALGFRALGDASRGAALHPYCMGFAMQVAEKKDDDRSHRPLFSLLVSGYHSHGIGCEYFESLYIESFLWKWHGEVTPQDR